MESTGKYWFPVHNILEQSEQGFHIVVTHPKVRQSHQKQFENSRADSATPTNATPSGFTMCSSSIWRAVSRAISAQNINYRRKQFGNFATFADFGPN
ncbi:MAG: hypothetical protein LBM98_08700 [Oscillospiraceae bacterium]|jgi:hypothetical protein|nr:hypothetical protein [Oscillospiraceae bacterium]